MMIQKKMNIKTILLNYTLCNETSMANQNENYKIIITLNELY